MTILLILGGVMVIVAIVLASAASGVTSSGRAATGIDRSVAVLEAMTGAPAELTKEIDRPFSDRIMEPLQAKAVAVSRRLSGSDATERIRKKLDVAGNPEGWTVERVLAGKVIGAISLFLISLALTAVMGTSFTTRVVMVVGATLKGFLGPNFYL
jgi:tight adherence protein C